jgi:alpha-N-arabinofuranosidase
VFAPTIRYHEGRFYVVTTNNSTGQNFYVYTDDVYGEWSEPVYVRQGGIDPSLYFEGDRTYFISTCPDDSGVDGITQCEIDVTTGEKLTPSVNIWCGTGGRYVEGPHMYHFGEYYYLLVAEGGTEYGHMATYARSRSVYGPFESYPGNPLLTNRNLGGYEVQGVGHGELIQDEYGHWWMVHLAFRQIDRWLQYHHLGRETFLTPMEYRDGWFSAVGDGVTLKRFQVDYPVDVVQVDRTLYTFEDTDRMEWLHVRIPQPDSYAFDGATLTLKGTTTTLDDVGSPTYVGLRQRDFDATLTCTVSVESGLGGVSVYMDEQHHYDLYVQGGRVVLKLNVGDVKHVQNALTLPQGTSSVVLKVTSNHYEYAFSAYVDGVERQLGTAQTRYVSTEVAGGFTGVVLGLYAQEGVSHYRDFRLEYSAS